MSGNEPLTVYPSVEAGVGDFALLPVLQPLPLPMEDLSHDNRNPVPLQKDSDPACPQLQMDCINPRPGAQQKKEEKETSIVSSPLTVEIPFSALAPTPWSCLSPSLPQLPSN